MLGPSRAHNFVDGLGDQAGGQRCRARGAPARASAGRRRRVPHRPVAFGRGHREDAPRPRVPRPKAGRGRRPLRARPPVGGDDVVRGLVGGARESPSRAAAERDHQTLRGLPRRSRGAAPQRRRRSWIRRPRAVAAPPARGLRRRALEPRTARARRCLPGRRTPGRRLLVGGSRLLRQHDRRGPRTRRRRGEAGRARREPGRGAGVAPTGAGWSTAAAGAIASGSGRARGTCRSGHQRPPFAGTRRMARRAIPRQCALRPRPLQALRDEELDSRKIIAGSLVLTTSPPPTQQVDINQHGLTGSWHTPVRTDRGSRSRSISTRSLRGSVTCTRASQRTP